MILFSHHTCLLLSDSQSSHGSAHQEPAEGDEASAEGYSEEEGEFDENFDGYDGYQEGYEDEGAPQQGSNQMTVMFSYTLMNQVRQVARAEGVSPEDFVLELVAEGVTRRAFEDANRPAPSHLMTRTGYVPPEADGYQAPKLSHHYNMNGNQNYGNGNQRRHKRNKNNYHNGGNRYGNNNNGNGNGNGNFNGNVNGNQKPRFDNRKK